MTEIWLAYILAGTGNGVETHFEIYIFHECG
jgi:hypothetical protein